MNRALVFTMAFVAVAFMTASATIINVPYDYETIQEGIDASSDGDTVLVQPGTYVENINFNGHNIVLGSLFLTTGDTTYISETIVDGDSAAPVLTMEYADSSTVIIGLTIQNGLGSGQSQTDPTGGGIVCKNNSNPLITHNIIRENVVIGNYARGGGIQCEYSNPSIIGNLITGNLVVGHYSRGGGISIYYASPTINGNVISGNAVDYHQNRHGDGGGIYCYLSDPRIMGNVISDNYAGSDGAGIGCRGFNGVIESNFILNNSAFYGGAGIDGYHLESSIKNNVIAGNSALVGAGIHLRRSSPEIINNSISGNSSDVTSGIYAIHYSNPRIINIIIWGNAVSAYGQLYIANGLGSVTYSCIQYGYSGEGNLDNDPLFRDPENGDFHLMSTACGDTDDSPSIDSGHPDINDELLNCLRGQGTILSDMGAYGGGNYICVYIPGDVNYNGIPVELGDVIAMIGMYRGSVELPYECPCPPHEFNFFATADPNGNCIANEISDVVTEIAAYRGGTTVSSCADCPGSRR